MLILFWIVGAICVGIYWQRKGGTGILATLWCLLFSPLLVGLCCLASSPNILELERRQIAAGDMKQCPACAELIRDEASLCRYCQTVQAPPVQLR